MYTSRTAISFRKETRENYCFQTVSRNAMEIRGLEESVKLVGIPGGKCSCGKSTEGKMSLGDLQDGKKTCLINVNRSECPPHHHPILSRGSTKRSPKNLMLRTC